MKVRYKEEVKSRLKRLKIGGTKLK
jgi:hypothetical protein